MRIDRAEHQRGIVLKFSTSVITAATLLLCGQIPAAHSTEKNGIALRTPDSIAAELEAAPPSDLGVYYAIKVRVGNAGVDAIKARLFEDAKASLSEKWKPGQSICNFPIWYHEATTGLDLAKAANNDSEWKTNDDQVSNAIMERQRLHDQVMSGVKVDPIYDHSSVPLAARAITLAAGSRARELADRAAEDQFQRNNFSALQQHRLWAADLNAAGQAYMALYDANQVCHTDLANLQWIKADLAANGWPKLSTDGAAMAHDAYILVQHADRDIDFQKHVLSMMEPLLGSKDVNTQDYAYLFDRVARNSGQPSRYGSQGQCVDNGKWSAGETEDPAKLDERRASMGLGPEADYVNHMSGLCSAEK
ncbi:MAG: DUF6624 domain-containing protein [Asticcacaulis sp.]|uniref:DUF6624 domain-containing protein n=1 Tax=Asticcacaulis sp. TaxID=1872648 RepID=UPI003F7BBDDD